MRNMNDIQNPTPIKVAIKDWWLALSVDEQEYLNSFESLTTTKVSLSESVEIFKEDLEPILKDKVKELYPRHQHLTHLLELKEAALKRKFKKDSWFWVMWERAKFAEGIATVEIELENVLAAYSKLKATDNNLDWESKVESAKQTPIESIVPSKLRKVGKRLVGLCPLHTEKTPSFTVYLANNSYFCFGCSAGGDVINLKMSIENIKFSEAVRRLQ